MWFEDKAWRSAAQWVFRLAGRCDYVLAPEPLQSLTPRCVPLEFSYCIPEALSCGIVCPKDDVDRLSLEWIRKLRSFQLLFVDDVFAVFSTAPLRDLPTPDEKTVVRETPYLWSKLAAVLGGIPVRKNHIDTSLSTAGPGNPYCLIVNACLTGNAGDRLLGAAACELVARMRPDLSCVLADPDVDRSLIARASLVVLGPGGTFYDLVDHAQLAIDFQNIANYFRLGYIARDYHRPFCIIGLGLAQQSRIASRTTLEFVKGAISDAIFVTTRDSDTAKLFVEDLQFRHPIVVTPDVSILFSQEIRNIPSNPSQQRSIAICGSFGVGAILAALKQFAGEKRFVLQSDEDANWFAQHEHEIRAELSNVSVSDVRSGTVNVFLHAVASVDTIVTSRFHAMMIGIIAGIETVVFGVINDKRHRVCSSLKNEKWITFIDGDVADQHDFQSIIEKSVRSGRRLASRGNFDATHLDEICRLIASTAALSPAVAAADKINLVYRSRIGESN
jgi:polysaccharide pyruvyl transferase WcaK-like protein